MCSVIKIIIIFFILVAKPSLGSTLHHTIERFESIRQIQTLGACVAMIKSMDHHCNPAFLSQEPKKGFSLELNLKAEEKAYESTHQLLFEKLEKDDVAALFEEKEFLSYSGNFRLEAGYSSFLFWYVPFQAVVASKISNPSLPQLSAAGYSQSVIGFTVAQEFELELPWTRRLFIGGSFYRYERDIRHIDTNIVEFIVKSADELTVKTQESAYDADIGLLLHSDHSFVPSLAVVGRDLLNHSSVSDRIIDIETALSRSITAGASWHFSHLTGQYSIGFSTIFRGANLRNVRDETASSISYQIGGLQTFFALSPLSRGFGFIFTHPVYHVGIKYSNEKQDNFLQLQRKDHVYLFAKITI